jgi:phosphatidylserine/phosphatidylglycerophosphate/cardiolipin synthase-like enzyme
VRFKSSPRDGFQLFAVTGVNTVSFAVQASAAARRGLLGFAIERFDPEEDQRFVMPGFKVFRSVLPQPHPHLQVSTSDHPVQSFVWDDFTGKPDREYEYSFRPLRGRPKSLDRTARPIVIRVRTEKLFGDDEHDVFFNRGVASSQAYERRFGLQPLGDLKPAKRAEALRWLQRDLETAILRFIGHARKGDTLLGCFYEFRHQPVADALQTARTRGVDVRIIVDAKVNESTDSKGVFHESFPREDNLRTIRKTKLPRSSIILREANPADIQHNKFLVLLRGAALRPAEVWTGSTNLSLGGLTGQTNVGHWVRGDAVARQFKAYWDLLATNDPGSKKGDDAATSRTKKAALRAAVAALGTVPDSPAGIPAGVTPVFSPRRGLAPLDLYVQLVDKATTAAGVTLAFGVNKAFKDQLRDNTAQSQIVFLLLEKKDQPNRKSKTPFVAINASNNVYKAWGAFVRTPVYQWARETNAGILGLNRHVSYVHSKFLLHDPLGEDPIVVTGSANFSEASTNANDENMLIIRGNRRVADIYFTEFNRLFNHYYFRAVMESRQGAGSAEAGASLFLDESGTQWVKKYAPGRLRAKRVKVYTSMKGFTTLP